MRRGISGLFRAATGGLTFRLLLFMSMALLPLGAISINATSEMQRAAQRAGERSLITLAADSVAGKRALVESALASARALEPVVLDLRADPEACSEMLRGYVARANIYSFAGFISLDGTVRCRTQGVEVNFGDSAAFQRLRNAPAATITANPAGQATGLPVIIVSRPVFDTQGLAGFLSFSITRSTLEAIAQRRIEDAPQLATIINHEGAVLTLSPEDPALAHLPSDEALAELAASPGSRVLRTTTREGAPVVVALAQLIPGRLHALAVWEPDAPLLEALDANPVPLVFPAAMWLASLAVVLLSVHYLVLQHLRQINRKMRRFALGQRADWSPLPGHVPAELRELDGTFRNMSRLIARDEDERERALAEKTVLLKEIHHRVKNNLQLIASVINLQLRQLGDPAARQVLQNVHQRVLGLAGVHRALYAEDQLATVRADKVIEELLGRVAGLGATPGRAPELRLNMAPLTLDADQMVPLSFLLHEAVTNALKHLAAAPQGQGWSGSNWIALELGVETGPDSTRPDATRPDAETGPGPVVTLRLRNPMRSTATAEADAPGTADGLGTELIEAFALQLGGTCRQQAVEDPEGQTIWELELRFPATEGNATLPTSAPKTQGTAQGIAAGR